MEPCSMISWYTVVMSREYGAWPKDLVFAHVSPSTHCCVHCGVGPSAPHGWILGFFRWWSHVGIEYGSALDTDNERGRDGRHQPACQVSDHTTQRR